MRPPNCVPPPGQPSYPPRLPCTSRRTRSPVVPPVARGYVDMRNPPDECIWFANVLTSKHHHHEETRNVPLHLMQSDLHAHLHRYLSKYGLVGPFKDDLGHIADLAHMIVHERYQKYREWTRRCTNNRARFLELQAYERFAQGLLILSTHLDPAERSQELAHESRCCLASTRLCKIS